jgi:hypothetical protein
LKNRRATGGTVLPSCTSTAPMRRHHPAASRLAQAPRLHRCVGASPRASRHAARWPPNLSSLTLAASPIPTVPVTRSWLSLSVPAWLHGSTSRAPRTSLATTRTATGAGRGGQHGGWSVVGRRRSFSQPAL